MSVIVPDGAMQAAKMALNGLAMRQEMIGQNIANVDTPGYHAQNLSFESAVKKAMQTQDGMSMGRTHAAHLTPASDSTAFFTGLRTGGTERADGNNVDIDTELIQMTETGLRFQTLSQTVSKKLALLKAIASAR